MDSLNRYPLLGLWAKKCAERLGYDEDDAQIIGQSYALIFCIRKQSGGFKTGRTRQGWDPR